MSEPVPRLRDALYDAGRIMAKEFGAAAGYPVHEAQQVVLREAVRRMMALIQQVPAGLACTDDVVISITYREAHHV